MKKVLVGLVKVELVDFNFDFQFDKPVIGVDEVGRGSWAGPVMAGAAFLNHKLPIEKRLNDSKRLTSKTRKEIFRSLSKNSIFGIGEVSNNEIDHIGILNATFKAMEIALTNLMKKKSIAQSIILIDGTIMPKFNKNFDSEIILVKKGDTLSPSIAAASIFAKCIRDDFMIKIDKKFSGYGFATNMGYGTRQHREKLILTGPTQMHRMTFNPMRKLN